MVGNMLFELCAHLVTKDLFPLQLDCSVSKAFNLSWTSLTTFDFLLFAVQSISLLLCALYSQQKWWRAHRTDCWRWVVLMQWLLHVISHTQCCWPLCGWGRVINRKCDSHTLRNQTYVTHKNTHIFRQIAEVALGNAGRPGQHWKERVVGWGRGLQQQICIFWRHQHD